MSSAKKVTSCPICNKDFPTDEIESHANRCIFLNCVEDDLAKRKRSPSPVISVSQPKVSFTQKSPRNLSRQFVENPVKHTENSASCSNSTSISFKPNLSFIIPLAKQIQPKTLNDFYGQNQVLGKATVLRDLLEKAEIPNMILWGPPGCGKTSLSGIISEICKMNSKKLRFSSLCAASAGVKEVQNIITISKNEMKFGKKTVLFMDEIHAFNKKQQDTMLLSVERGEITLVGATTENPSFSINSALLSRCRVIVMDKLDSDTLYEIVKQAAIKFNLHIINHLTNPQTHDQSSSSIEDEALKWLADVSDGDARIALNNLQLVIQHNENGKVITVGDIKEGLKKSHMLYDRKGEEHYNLISAMHKSIRGSDENAALYWTTRMIVSGEDPRFIARRLVRAASEDIGNADPAALPLAVATMQGCQLLGMPEADVLLAQCAIYLARAPKSREADSALAKAKSTIVSHKGPQPAVPMHIRNAPTKLMKNLGYGKLQQGASYTFMPPELKDVNFFKK
ncbi:ATPase WRNIP1-like [Diabrotica virgifera virgifera]|uniref:AAA+ ATPase domain-containing protein n=1 Tax=Diabrotica virgifera virgifera TaxID=50390 RepID=A0ABM5IDL5_DIAVI|nr:ATPase WRNIP1-like [Diabrotica virgifera virgifera]